MEVNMQDDLVEELFIFLEEKVRNNVDSDEEAELYESYMMNGKIHIRFDKVLRNLKKELYNM